MPQTPSNHYRGKPDPTDPNSMTGIVQHFRSLAEAIQYAEQNHRTSGQNLANLNTPGYRALEIPFDQLLSRINGESASGEEYAIHETEGLEVRSDGNNIDLDRELAMLKKNALAYQTLTQLLGSKMGILKQAING